MVERAEERGQGDFEGRMQKLIEPVPKELVDQARGRPEADFLYPVEKILIKGTLQETKGNQLQEAILLAMSRNTLCSKIERYKIKNEVVIVWENCRGTSGSWPRSDPRLRG